MALFTLIGTGLKKFIGSATKKGLGKVVKVGLLGTGGLVVLTGGLSVVPAVMGGFTPNNYIANSLGYYVIGFADMFWQPIAGFINAGIGLVSVIVNFFLTLFGSSSTWFSYYIVALLFIFFFALIVKLVIFCKNLILRWL